MTPLEWVANVACLIACASSWVFVGYYGWSQPWRQTREGRALMYRTFALACLLSLNSAGIWLHDYPGRPIIRVAVYIGMGAAVTWFTIVLFRVPRDPRQRKPHPRFDRAFRRGVDV